MTGEGQHVNTDDTWNLVNYVQSFPRGSLRSPGDRLNPASSAYGDSG